MIEDLFASLQVIRLHGNLIGSRSPWSLLGPGTFNVSEDSLYLLGGKSRPQSTMTGRINRNRNVFPPHRIKTQTGRFSIAAPNEGNAPKALDIDYEDLELRALAALGATSLESVQEILRERLPVKCLACDMGFPTKVEG